MLLLPTSKHLSPVPHTHWAPMVLVAVLAGCSGEGSGKNSGTAPGIESGGTSTGGAGVATGGLATGGVTTATGGVSNGGVGTGGTSTGGQLGGSGGLSTGGGDTTGGTPSGGLGGSSDSGGTGGTGAGGAGATGGSSPVGGVAGAGATGGSSATGGMAGSDATGGTASSTLKPRVVALTDIAPDDVEPDDSESLIHLYAVADLLEVEAVIAGSGYSSGNYPPDWADRIGRTIDAYEADAPNLLQRSNQTGFVDDENEQEIGYWPSPDYLRTRWTLGSPGWGTSLLGPGNDSDGSQLIIQLGDEDDDRPIWITVWGGGNTFAQALWRVQNDRSQDEFRAFVRKFRIYTITDQDKAWGSTDFLGSSHQWMRSQGGAELLFLWDECAWLDHNTWGVNRWDSHYAQHIQGHGHLGGIYSKYRWGVEGDTPSFLHVMPNGLNDPNEPGQGSWGGFFAYGQTVDGQTSAWVNEEPGAAYDTCAAHNDQFFAAAFNDFAARMDWADMGAGNRNPSVVVNGNGGREIIVLAPTPGSSITLDAGETSDPDGDELSFRWWVYDEAGSYHQSIEIAGADSPAATVSVPENAGGESFHVICEVTDSGTPNLTSYRRIIFEPTG